MADDLTPGPPTVMVTVKVKVRIVYDAAGNSPFADDSVVEGDLATASAIWQQAGIRFEAESIEPWTADRYFDLLKSEGEDLRAEHWYEGQRHINIYYVEAIEKGAGWGSFPGKDGPDAVCIEDTEERAGGAAAAAAWRGIALAHELGHYFNLKHTHPKDPTLDATYDDGCADTDIADPNNVMTQGKRGRTTDSTQIHLTADQILRARTALFGSRANLVADVIAAALG